VVICFNYYIVSFNELLSAVLKNKAYIPIQYRFNVLMMETDQADEKSKCNDRKQNSSNEVSMP